MEQTPDQNEINPTTGGGGVVVGSYPDFPAAEEHALVVSAMGYPYRIEVDQEGFVLETEAQHAAEVIGEIAGYERDRRRDGDVEAVQLPTYRGAGWAAFGWAALIAIVFSLQTRIPGLSEIGASSNEGLFDRVEWWRPLTAQFLHSGLGHLISNLAPGVLFGVYVGRSLGVAWGWGVVVVGAMLGNVLTGFVYWPEPFSSLGASSSVFAALGVLTGYGAWIAVRSPANAPWKTVLLPLGGGAALLGLWGFGDERTDVIGHVLGFVCGGVLGFLATELRLRKLIRQPASRG